MVSKNPSHIHIIVLFFHGVCVCVCVCVPRYSLFSSEVEFQGFLRFQGATCISRNVFAPERFSDLFPPIGKRMGSKNPSHIHIIVLFFHGVCVCHAIQFSPVKWCFKFSFGFRVPLAF